MSCHANAEDFQLEDPYGPLLGKTLEEVIANGESDWEKEQDKEWITLNNEPQWLHAVVIRVLKKRHKNTPTASATERLLLKLGIVIIRDRFGAKVSEISRLWSQICITGDQLSLMRMYKGSRYELQEAAGTTYRKCSVRAWVAGAITDNLVDALSLSTATAVMLTLIAGVSASKEWVPLAWRNLAEKELAHFDKHLSDEVQKLGIMVSDTNPQYYTT